MIRILLTVILPMALPASVYFLWFANERRRAIAAGTPETMPRLGDVPWFVLASAGIAIAAVVLFATSIYSGDEPGETYVPPHLENGRVVPGTSK
ncbi:MAG: hypothetical protein EXQ95_03260 [Alphaproteobacteria bacterium]|nr:hypothetical protein [Alphaproteobacteria bacterium]